MNLALLCAEQWKHFTSPIFAIQERQGKVTYENSISKNRITGYCVAVLILAGSLFDYLMANGVIVDWREPNVIRFAPAPLYCSFEDMYEFGQILKRGILNK